MVVVSKMDKLILLVVLISIANVVISNRPSAEGYYWRDYEGLIPVDALPGGLDRSGRPIYIGQALFEDKLIPGKIYENGSVVYFMWGTERSTDKNVKILCSQYPEKFQWIRTKPSEVMLLTDKLLVNGGYTANTFTYIGRVYTGGETLVGKVKCEVASAGCIALYVTRDGAGIEHKDAFEILTYNPNVNTVDPDGCNTSTDLKINI